MATYRYVSYDLLTSLRKMTDDADIRLFQVIYWLQVVANKIRVDQFLTTDTGLFTSTFSQVTVQTDANGKKYIDLPAQVMDLPNEEGIEMITYCAERCNPHPESQVFFQPTTLSKSVILSWNEYTKPSTSNPYFYRVGDKVDGVKVNRLYLLGLDCYDVDCLDIAIRCSLDPKSVCDLDDEIPIPDERIEELTKEVLSLGRFVMMIPEERINQGTDEGSQQAPPPPSAQ